MFKYYCFPILLLLSVTFLTTCGEDDDCTEYVYPWCPNYDPCNEVFPADAEFVLIDSTVWTDSLFSIEVDTTLSYSQFFFRPKRIQTETDYKWMVGSDTRVFEGAVNEVSFLGFEGEVDIELTVEVNDRNECLLEAEEYATATQSIYIKDHTVRHAPIWGTYSGANEDRPQETYEVDLKGWRTDLFDSFRLFQLKLPDDCDLEEVGIPLGGGYSWAVSDFVNRNGSSRCRKLTVVCRLEAGDYDKIRVDYWYDGDNGERTHHVFRGTKQ